MDKMWTPFDEYNDERFKAITLHACNVARGIMHCGFDVIKYRNGGRTLWLEVTLIDDTVIKCLVNYGDVWHREDPILKDIMTSRIMRTIEIEAKHAEYVRNTIGL